MGTPYNTLIQPKATLNHGDRIWQTIGWTNQNRTKHPEASSQPRGGLRLELVQKGYQMHTYNHIL